MMVKKIEAIRDWIGSLDKTMLYTSIGLMAFGWLQIMSVSSAIGYRTSIKPMVFGGKQTIFVIMGVITILVIASMSMKSIAAISFPAIAALMFILMLMPLITDPVKGSKRWIRLLGINIQPSDVMKPFFIVINGIILGNQRTNLKTSFVASATLFALVAAMLMAQPDIGMTFIYFCIWAAQSLIANMPLKMYAIGAGTMPIVGGLLYASLDHFRFRISNFAAGVKPYQVEKSLTSMAQGGLFGRGLGDGSIKYQLPDVHSDYIFSSIGEEWGLIFCIFLLSVYLFLIIHCIHQIMWERNNAKRIIGFGIIAMLFAHVFMSVGVSSNLLPPKGTTLPFVSYGGSSILSACFCMGMMISITSKDRGINNSFERTKRKLFWDSILQHQGRIWRPRKTEK